MRGVWETLTYDTRLGKFHYVQKVSSMHYPSKVDLTMDLNDTLVYGTDEPNLVIMLQVFYWERILISVLVGLIAIIGIIGNSMTILAVAFSQTLQTPTNAFVTSLSVADLLTSFCLIWAIVGFLGETAWPLPRAYWLCQFTAFMLYACISTSMWNLGTIAVNRLILITRPLLHKKIFTSWKLGILVAIPWTMSGGVILIFLMTGNGAVGYDKTDTTCSDIDSHEKADIFSYGQLGLGWPIPITAIIVSYVWIYIYLKRHFKMQKQTMFDQETRGTELPAVLDRISDGANGSYDFQRDKISQQQIQITKNLFFVVCAFFICFIPFLILDPLSYNSVLGTHIKFYSGVLVFANSAINFFIYARKHPNFKVVLGHMIRCSYADIPKPSKLLKLLLSKHECCLCCYNISILLSKFVRKLNCSLCRIDEMEEDGPVDESISALEKNCFEYSGYRVKSDVDKVKERSECKYYSPQTMSIDIYKRIGWSNRYCQIQILEGVVPTEECKDTQAVVVIRDEGDVILASSIGLLQEDVEAEYQAAKAEGGKYVSKGVVLTKAGTNSGYVIHLTIDRSIVKRREALITSLQVAEKNQLKSIAFPSYLLSKISINQFVQMIGEFAKTYHPICLDFVQLFVTKHQFGKCREIRQNGGDLRSYSS